MKGVDFPGNLCYTLPKEHNCINEEAFISYPCGTALAVW